MCIRDSGIIVILAVLIVPAILAPMTGPRQSDTVYLIHQVEIAAQAYFNDYGDYPPSTWAELDEFLRYDSSRPGGGPPDGIYSRADDEVFFTFPPGPPDPTTNPSTLNEGIEVLTACLATQKGGPYLEPGADQTGNTDGDTDDGTIAGALNWHFAGNEIFELVDYWGNPLVYIHNRDYAAHDGWIEGPAGAFEDPTGPGASEYLLYVDADGNTVPCYGRWDNRTGRTGDAPIRRNYPNRSGFQLYSWGPDLQPGCAESQSSPGTPNPNEPGVWPGWIAKSGNLVNWQE